MPGFFQIGRYAPVRGLFRSTVVACLLAGVVLVSSGFAVVSGTVAIPGGVCSKAGASVVSRGVSLVCKKSGLGKLVWRVVEASTASTTTTTTTVAPTTASAPKVAVVAPRVVSALSATGNAVITIDDMSPDTGVYAVQWVSSGQNFNSYQMYRATTKTMTVPYLSCSRSHTLRVFVMQANWQMTDGFVNQNVTPHSTTFDLTMPACTATAVAAATTTTTVAVTCATGGVCVVGDTGPGGGVVFYVQAAGGTFACGATLASTCKYLEAAPTTGTNEWTDAGRTWATNISSNQSTLVSGADGTAIGTGYQNSLDIVAQTGNVAATSAAVEASAYRGPNSKTDWYLPSKNELNELCKYARTQTTGNTSTTCSSSGTLRVGFSSDTYWSSSEYYGYSAWGQRFYSGDQTNSFKASAPSVRPVRAFG